MAKHKDHQRHCRNLKCKRLFKRLDSKQKYCSPACEAEVLANQHPGIAEEWLDLPRRRCDNCPKIFKPKRPDQKYCSTECRNEFKNHHGAFVKLKALVIKEAEKQTQLEERCPECKGKGQVNKGGRLGVVVCETCVNGRVLTRLGRDVLALIQSGHAKEIQQ